MPGPVIELDARKWRTGMDFYEALLKKLGAPARHGRNANALIDSMIRGGINAIEAPYTIRVVGTSRLPAEARNEMLKVVNILSEVLRIEKETERTFEFQIEP